MKLNEQFNNSTGVNNNGLCSGLICGQHTSMRTEQTDGDKTFIIHAVDQFSP